MSNSQFTVIEERIEKNIYIYKAGKSKFYFSLRRLIVSAIFVTDLMVLNQRTGSKSEVNQNHLISHVYM